jgi:hypothetical protein
LNQNAKSKTTQRPTCMAAQNHETRMKQADTAVLTAYG